MWEYGESWAINWNGCLSNEGMRERVALLFRKLRYLPYYLSKPAELIKQECAEPSLPGSMFPPGWFLSLYSQLTKAVWQATSRAEVECLLSTPRQEGLNAKKHEPTGGLRSYAWTNEEEALSYRVLGKRRTKDLQ